MNSTLRIHLELYRTGLNFKPANWISDKCKVFSEYLVANKLTGAVISVSGGVDSAVTLGLCLETQKRYPDILKKVLPITQPIHSSAWAQGRSQELCDSYGVKLAVIDQTPIFDQLKTTIDESIGVNGNQFVGGQLKSYMRTPANYYAAQLMSQSGFPSIVMGTGNLDEDGYLAYYCKAGDGVVDLQLISDLHKSQVFTVGKELNVIDSILSAPPSADLWEGHTDEDEMEISYDAVELFLGVYRKLADDHHRSQWECMLTGDAAIEWAHIKDRCETIHNRNKQRLAGVVNL